MPGIVDRSLAIGVTVVGYAIAGPARDGLGEFDYRTSGPEVAPIAFMQPACGLLTSFTCGQDPGEFPFAVSQFAAHAARMVDSPGPAFVSVRTDVPCSA